MKIWQFLENHGPKVWTKGDWAKDVHGRGVIVEADTAVCWCSSGLIYRLSESDPEAAMDAFSKQIGTDRMGEWNDAPERTFEEVLEAFKRADL